jgi:hypothetical protein
MVGKLTMLGTSVESAAHTRFRAKMPQQIRGE